MDVAGERCIYMFPNVTGKISVYQVLHRFAPHIQAAKHFHTEASQLPIAPVKEAMKVAHDGKVRVIFDLDVSPSFFAESNLGTQDELCTALRLVDVLKPCKAAARELTGEGDYEKIATALLRIGPKSSPSLSALTAASSPRPKSRHSSRLQSGRCGHHRRGRRLHGRPFLRSAARLGYPKGRPVRECLRRALLHKNRRPRNGQA